MMFQPHSQLHGPRNGHSGAVQANTPATTLDAAVDQSNCLKPDSNRKAQRGFTLIEAIIVIVIASIVASVVATFMSVPVQGYIDSAAQAELTDVADTALRRMAAMCGWRCPNSIRTATGLDNNPYLPVLPTVTGGRYLRTEDSAIDQQFSEFHHRRQ